MKIVPVRSKGFTMLELLVAISIITILATISLVALRSQGGRARDARRKADLAQVKTALEFFRKQNGTYPITPLNGTDNWWLGVCDLHGPPFSNRTVSGANAYIPGLSPQFISILPVDPRNEQPSPHTSCTELATNAGLTSNQITCYLYRSDGVNYKMISHCTAESPISTNDPYYDPCRPNTSYQISSSPVSRGPLLGGCDYTTNGW